MQSTYIQGLLSASTANCRKYGSKHKICLTGSAQRPPHPPKHFIAVSNGDTIQTEQASPAPSVSHSLHAPAVPGMLEGPTLTHPLNLS